MTSDEQDPGDQGGDLEGGPSARRRRRVAAGLGQAGRRRRRQAAGADDRGAGRAQASCARRTSSCGAPTTSCRQRRLSSGRSSTADTRSSRLHRRPPGPKDRWASMGGRADLRTSSQVAPSTYYDAKSRPPSARAVRDAELGPEARRRCGSTTTRSTDGASSTKAARRAGLDVGRDQVARLMRCQGIRGASRAKKRFTTKADPDARPRPGPRQPQLHRHPSRRPVGAPTSPTARRGRASSTSPSSSTSSPGASSAGRRRGR